MGLAEEFERRLERLVEGFFSKTFRSDLEPAEIGRRLLREQEGGKKVSVGAVYVPNVYDIRLSESDHERLEGLLPALRREFTALLQANAGERRWKFAGPLVVRFGEGSDVGEGKFEVEASHEAAAEAPEDEPEAPVVRLAGSDPAQEWELQSKDVTIGRLSSCEIVIADPNVSRRHAQIVRRGDGWWVVDLGSTNGTLVNDALVKERRLDPGDRIQVGGAELEYSEKRA